MAFAPDPALDMLADVPDGVARWSENMFFQAWDPERGLGLFTHIGRVSGAPHIWRCCLAIYLPDGRVLAHRSYGQAPDRHGPATGSMVIRCEEPGRRWSLSYDGVAELTDSAATGRGLVGAGPSRPLKMGLTFESRSPTYDLFAARGLGTQEFAHTHHEQAFHVTGSVVFDGEARRLEGPGFRDHSVGARDLSGFGGNTLFFASFPSGRVVQALRNYTPDGDVKLDSGFLVENATGELLELSRAPKLESTLGDPVAFEIGYVRDGTEIVLAGETLHAAAFTIGMPNDWSIGTDTMEADPLIILEQPCRVTWPDGEVGYGNLERNFRRSMLRLPG